MTQDANAQGTLNNAGGVTPAGSNDYGFIDSSTMGAVNALPMDGVDNGITPQQQGITGSAPIDIEKVLAEIAGGASQQTQQNQQADPNAQGDPNAQSNADPMRFDLHPRWQEREKELTELRTTVDLLKQQILGSQQRQQPDPQFQQQPQANYRDVTTMSNDDIEKWFGEDKVGFMANFYAQVASETKQNIMSELGQREQQKSVAQVYEQFANKNPEIKSMWASGQIQQFMNQNPGHTPISAYYELKGFAPQSNQNDVQKQIDEAVAKANKETTERIFNQLRAKFSATGILGAAPGSGSGNGSDTNTSLKVDVKAGGNLNQLLAQKLEAMRSTGAK